VAHRRRAKRLVGRLVVAGLILGLLPPAARAAVGGGAAGGRVGPSLISLSLNGREADGPSFTPAISGDGRYVAFASAGSTLVPGDTNGVEDVFVYDRQSRTTERVSLSSAGDQGNDDSYGPAISADGRYVAFTSAASNLVPGDSNGELDVFVRDRVARTTVLASVGPHGTLGDGPSGAPSISGDGRLVAFESDADNLVPNDGNRTGDVFVHDLVAGATRLVSVGGGGQPTESPSFDPAISADGSSVAFESFSSRLVPGDTNGALDVFVADLPTGNISRVSVATDGGQADDRSYNPSISADGRMVAFASFADNLVPGDTNGLLDVFVRRRDQQTTTRLSVGPGGEEANGLSFSPVVSADGAMVVFSSEASNLVPDDTNGLRDVFLACTATGVVTRLSQAAKGAAIRAQGNGPSLGPVLDASGAMVAFASFATNLVPGDTNGQSDVFVAPSPAMRTGAAQPPAGKAKRGR
jgi:Tol biopolymer transport system component